MTGIMTDRVMAVCPDCAGCGRVSLCPNTGRWLPQPTFTSTNTTAQGWTACQKYQESGMVASLPNER